MATLNELTLDTTKQDTHVVTNLSSVKLLSEHLNTSDSGLDTLAVTDNIDFITLVDDTSLGLDKLVRKRTVTGKKIVIPDR